MLHQDAQAHPTLNYFQAKLDSGVDTLQSSACCLGHRPGPEPCLKAQTELSTIAKDTVLI